MTLKAKHENPLSKYFQRAVNASPPPYTPLPPTLSVCVCVSLSLSFFFALRPPSSPPALPPPPTTPPPTHPTPPPPTPL